MYFYAWTVAPIIHPSSLLHLEYGSLLQQGNTLRKIWPTFGKCMMGTKVVADDNRNNKGKNRESHK
jgi:hypothetical protein